MLNEFQSKKQRKTKVIIEIEKKTKQKRNKK